MKISGFTYIRNGKTLDYPFIESIRSALPACDEMIVVVGDSTDGTREAVEAIGSEKIRIIDTVWDDELRKRGRIFALQSNLGLDHITGDWGLHIQADEVLHESAAPLLRKAMEKHLHDKRVEGFILPYHHFWGYHHVINSRRAHRFEVRVVRNNPLIRSFNDSQGFRMYPSAEAYAAGDPGRKLRVKKIPTHIHHYSRVRDPELEMKKVKHFARYWHQDEWIEKKFAGTDEWDYENIDRLRPFPKKDHPAVMQERVSQSKLRINYKRPKFHAKRWFLYHFGRLTGWHIGERRNYKLIR